MRTGSTEYILGRNTRSESRQCRGYSEADSGQPGALRFEYGPLRAVIENHDLHYRFHLDLDSGVYTASRIDEYGRVRGAGSRPTSLQSSGRTVHVHTKTVDTGERREMFGRTARRVTAHTSITYEPEAGSGPGITEVDGWYIDPPAAWLVAHPPARGHSILLASNDGRIDTPVFTDDGPQETGFRLLLTRRCHTTFTDPEGSLRARTFEDREEVAELSEEDLMADLFVPPRHFRRVPRLPGEHPVTFGMRARLCWERLKNALLGGR